MQAIIFDAGGVYLQGNFSDFVNRSYKVLGLNKTFSTQEEIVFDEDFNKGKVSAEECFRKYFGVPIKKYTQMQEILGLWKTTWKLQPKMRRLVNKLSDNYTLAILSNSDYLNTSEYKRKKWLDPFSVLVLSHEVGILKPDRRIYELTLERLGIPAESCVFIDDQEKNLVPARELGMRTILYRNLEQLTSEFERNGVKLNNN